MTILYHPGFAGDIQRFASKYAEISPKVGERFRQDIDGALLAVKTNPTGAGHYINTGSLILREVRRRNLDAFPFFVLYGLADVRLVFGSVIPSASDPLTWITRFK
jgi:hypothetical protein